MTRSDLWLTAVSNAHLNHARKAAAEAPGSEVRAIVSALTAIATEIAALRHAVDSYPEPR